MNRVYFIFSLFFFCIPFYAKSQIQSVPASDSAFYQNALANVFVWYQNIVGVNSPLYKGKEYLDYTFRIEGNQYFQSDLWEKGSVFYDGLLYEDVTMKYDVVNKVLIVDHAHLPVPISLESKKIDSFSLLGHDFIRLVADTVAQEDLSTDFYDLLYDGKTQFLVNRVKVLNDEIEDRKLRYWFENDDRYYIQKENMFYRVKSKKSVLDVFSDHKKDIRKYLKKNKIKFRQQREEAIHRIVMYYDQQVH